MTRREFLRAVRVVDAATLLVVVAAAGLAAWLAYPAAGPELPAVRASAMPRAPVPRRVQSLDELAVIAQRDLRQALLAAGSEARPADAELGIELIGTALEPGRQFGVFRLADGALVVRAPGAAAGDYEVLEITRGTARLRHGAREIELKVAFYERIARAAQEPR